MATVEDLLDVAYRTNDEAKAEQQARIALEDQRRIQILSQFADAKLIVTALRALEEASAGRLVAHFETQDFSDNPTVTIKIRDAQVAERAKFNRLTIQDESHGFRLLVNRDGVTLKNQKNEDYFLREARPDEMIYAENGWIREGEIKGVDPALMHVFVWAGNTKDENGKWYVERPNVRLVSFRPDKPAPNQ